MKTLAITETRERKNFSTEYTITGENALVDERIEDLKRDYHPCGYGTFVKRSEVLDAGHKRVVVWRANSCD